RPALAVAAVGAFVLSLNEGMVSLFLATPATETLPAAVWPLLKDGASPLVAVASCASAAASLAVAALVAALAARKRR
ncbi:MAG: ABC transporter permease, partial [Thermoleophilia bacterium]|nr:ABC transporter permease [Thermoleophilia bacterium]